MKKRLVSVVLTCCLTVLSFTGCAGNEISELNQIQSLSTVTEKEDANLTLSERQELVYAQVSERSLLNLTTLKSCTASEVQQVTTYMDSVNKQLTGEINADAGVIDESMTNYLLWFFEKTPYYWQRTQTAIQGIDDDSRSIVVDVTYDTIGFAKDTQSDSPLVQGEPEYNKKYKVRYERWLGILRRKYDSMNGVGGSNVGGWQQDLAKFKKVYGSPDKIFESQRNDSLTDTIYKTGNQKTYNGLKKSDGAKEGGTVTVRYVLVPKYILGINMGISCKHMYILNFNLSKDITESLSLFKEDGYATVSDNLYTLLDSYFKAVDERDMSGLYKLTDNFKAWDKYYSDMREYSYTKNGEFTVSLFDISGTTITCGVQVSAKERAKGSNMFTMPLYTDRYYIKVKLIGEQLKITDMTLLSRKIEGEPLIQEGENETSGFNEKIDLNNTDRVAIEKLLCDFGVLQLAGSEQQAYKDVVDLSMNSVKLKKMMEDVATVTGGKKAIFLDTYQQGNGNYASVKCRELHKTKKEVVESEVAYEFISKGGKWYVYGYDTLSSVTLGTVDFRSEGALAVVTPKKVESYTTQVSSSEGAADDKAGSDEVKAVILNHDLVKPKLKSDRRVKMVMSPETLSDSQFKSMWAGLSKDLTIDEMTKFDENMQLNAGVDGSMVGEAKKLVCLYANKKSGAYSKEEWQSAIGTFNNGYANYKQVWQERGDTAVIEAFDNVVSKVR